MAQDRRRRGAGHDRDEREDYYGRDWETGGVRRFGPENYGGVGRGGVDYEVEGFQPAGGYPPEGRGGAGRRSRGTGWRAPEEEAEPGPHRGKGPRGYRRSDERIREDVNDRLTDDAYVDAGDIEVSVSEGEVTLNGFIDSRAAKRRAEDVADFVTGVTHVQNNLRVRTPRATAAGASAIAERNRS